jgi:hypothetical protein
MVAKCTFDNFLANMAGSLFFQYGGKPVFQFSRKPLFSKFTVSMFFLTVLTPLPVAFLAN